MTKRILITAILTFMCSAANAEVVATCGASKGHGYYIPKGTVTIEDSGWSEEGISKGRFQLIRSGKNWDVVFTDSTGGTLSSRGDGGSISAIETKDGDIIVQVLYPINMETYVFWLSLKQPKVTYSQAKFATPIPKHSLMVANCKRGK